MSSEALKPDPVTELPLTPPAEEEDEDAAIHNLQITQKLCYEHDNMPVNTVQLMHRRSL